MLKLINQKDIMDKTINQPSNSVTSNGRSLRIALIGCGAIAERYYLPALARHPRVLDHLILVDQNIDRARKQALMFNCKRCFVDYREVLNETDGVIIALPTYLHHPVSMEFLSRSVPVLCEKPLAESADKAKEMVELAHRMGTALATNYSQRLWAQFAKVKEVIENRSMGKLVSIKYYVGEVFNWPTVSGFYFNSGGASRGILLDRGAHVMDHICWWLGSKPKVISSQNDSFSGREAVAQVHFKDNTCVGEVKLSWLSSFPSRFIVKFERGSIEGEVNYPQSVFITTGDGRRKRVTLKSERYSELGYRIVSNFIKVVSNSEKPLVQGIDVLDSTTMIDDCYATATRFEMPWYNFPEVKNDK
jgi:UDP-N-acetylglucosamine 3-dehydrogenase